VNDMVAGAGAPGAAAVQQERGHWGREAGEQMSAGRRQGGGRETAAESTLKAGGTPWKLAALTPPGSRCRRRSRRRLAKWRESFWLLTGRQRLLAGVSSRRRPRTPATMPAAAGVQATVGPRSTARLTHGRLFRVWLRQCLANSRGAGDRRGHDRSSCSRPVVT
jgi:hypothetical protein